MAAVVSEVFVDVVHACCPFGVDVCLVLRVALFAVVLGMFAGELDGFVNGIGDGVECESSGDCLVCNVVSSVGVLVPGRVFVDVMEVFVNGVVAEFVAGSLPLVVWVAFGVCL